MELNHLAVASNTGVVTIREVNWDSVDAGEPGALDKITKTLFKTLKKAEIDKLQRPGSRAGSLAPKPKAKGAFKSSSTGKLHCFTFAKTGSCSFGDDCKFKHITQAEVDAEAVAKKAKKKEGTTE